MTYTATLKINKKNAARADRGKRLKVFTRKDLKRIGHLKHVPEETLFDMDVVAHVLPFKVNQYIIEELIRWDDVPDDPIFRLTFPQRGMLSPRDFARMARAIRAGKDPRVVAETAADIRKGLNPHPAHQLELNVPVVDGKRLQGIQHKYRETVLFFPSQGQTCHAFCTFCFRWAQFIGDRRLKIACSSPEILHSYLASNKEVTDLLLTGGDPLTMRTRHLAAFLKPLTSPEFEHIQTIRIGSKALSYWPYRFVTDSDADDLLALFESLVEAGKHLALMAHLDHGRELETYVVQKAIARIRSTGAVIRSQAPLLRHINDDPAIWAEMWKKQVNLGIVPYYMFIARDTGAKEYFDVPLSRAWKIYRKALQQVSGLGRTARGPSMSTGPGKVEIQGVATVRGEKVFVLRMIQARNPDWVQRPFFAAYDQDATWLDQLKPAFGKSEFFFEPEYRALLQERRGMPA